MCPRTYMLAELLGECPLKAHLRNLVIQNERQAFVEDALKYQLPIQTGHHETPRDARQIGGSGLPTLGSVS